MGKPVVTVRLRNLVSNSVATIEREALADTGATYVVLPKSVADALALPPAGRRRVRYADGRTAERELVGGLLLEVEGRTAECRALVEPDGGQVLIGQLALEDLDLYVNCMRRRLVPRPESPDMPMAEELSAR